MQTGGGSSIGQRSSALPSSMSVGASRNIKTKTPQEAEKKKKFASVMARVSTLAPGVQKGGGVLLRSSAREVPSVAKTLIRRSAPASEFLANELQENIQRIKEELLHEIPVTHPSVLQNYLAQRTTHETWVSEMVTQYGFSTPSELSDFIALRSHLMSLRSKGDEIVARRECKNALLLYPTKSIHRALLLTEAAHLFANMDSIEGTVEAIEMYNEASTIYDDFPSKHDKAIECSQGAIALFEKSRSHFRDHLDDFNVRDQMVFAYKKINDPKGKLLLLQNACDRFMKDQNEASFRAIGSMNCAELSVEQMIIIAPSLIAVMNTLLRNPSLGEMRMVVFEKMREMVGLLSLECEKTSSAVSTSIRASIVEQMAFLYESLLLYPEKGIQTYQKAIQLYHEVGNDSKVVELAIKWSSVSDEENKRTFFLENPWLYDTLKNAGLFYSSIQDSIHISSTVTLFLKAAEILARPEADIVTFLQKVISAFCSESLVPSYTESWIQRTATFFLTQANQEQNLLQKAHLYRKAGIFFEYFERFSQEAIHCFIHSGEVYERLAEGCPDDEKINKAGLLLEASLAYQKASFPEKASTVGVRAAQMYHLAADEASGVERAKLLELSGKAFRSAGAGEEALSCFKRSGELYLLHADSLSGSTITIRKKRAELYERSATCFLKASDPANAALAREHCATQITFDRTHPLYAVQEAVRKGSIGKPLERMGAYFHEMDSSKIKRRTLHASLKTISEGDYKPVRKVIAFDFYLSHPARTSLDETIRMAEQNPGLLRIEYPPVEQPYVIPSYDLKTDTYSVSDGVEMGTCKELVFPNLGRVRIPSSPDFISLYNRIEIEIDEHVVAQSPDRALQTVHILLSRLGLGTVLLPSENEDKEKEKILLLSHTFFPSLAYGLERNEEVLSLSPSDIRKKIEELEPEAEAIFTKYLDLHPELLVERQMYSGRKSFYIADMGQLVRQNHGCGFLFGTQSFACRSLPWNDSIEEAKSQFRTIAKRYVQKLVTGVAMESNREDILLRGLVTHGSSPEADARVGGMDSVFTRMICDQAADRSCNFLDNEISYNQDGLRVLLDSDIAGFESTYAHTDDLLGTRADGGPYTQRLALPSFATSIEETFKIKEFNVIHNETMVRDCIGTEFVRGIVVPRAEMRAILIEEMELAGLIQEQEISGKLIKCVVLPGGRAHPVEKFLYIGNSVKKEMWS